LAKANERLTLEIEERRRAEDALKLFAYSVAHDLKSPAVGIYGLTKRLHKLSRDVLDEKSRSYCDQILKVSEHIAALVEMLNVYIATKEAHLSFGKTTLKEILGMIEDEFSVQLNIRQIDWIVPDSEVEITADRLSLVRVFRNLVDNALKYGGERLSRIRIWHEERGDCHIFSVIDDGKGLKGADSEKIFGLFQRHATSRGVEGAGLGLAIVKEIAQRHGGRAWVEPAAKEGTTFCICISKNL
jgi:light-regulated signal transduction histidine kinase (bacteriophytochrome)